MVDKLVDIMVLQSPQQAAAFINGWKLKFASIAKLWPSLHFSWNYLAIFIQWTRVIFID